MEIIKFCSKELRDNKRILFIFYIIIVIFTLTTLYITYFTGSFMDFLAQKNDFIDILVKCIFFGILCIVSTIMNSFQNMISTILNNKISFDLNKKVIVHLQNSDILNVMKEESVEMTEKITNDTNTITSFCINSLQNVFANIVYIFGTSIFLIYVDIRMSMFILIVLLIYILLYKIFNSRLYDATLDYQNLNARYISEINSQIKYIRNIKINDRYDYFKGRLETNFKNFFSKSINYQWIATIFGSLDTIVMRFAQVIIFIFGGYGIIKGKMGIGKVVVLVNYFNILLSGIRYFLNLGKVYQETKVSLDRIKIYLNYETEISGEIQIGSVDTIKMENVVFSYAENYEVIKNFSYTFHKGNIYGISGKNGKGKTTLVNLIIGLFNNHFQGNIYINNVDIRKIDVRHMRKKFFSFLEQNDILLNETIQNNILVSDIENSKYIELANMLNISVFIKDNINKVITDMHDNISGGQKKKISLLRVLLKDTEVLILDEPSAAMDKYTCSNLYEYIKTIKNEKIIILISHDSKYEEICDYILHL